MTQHDTRRREAGFTLLELLMVVIIIAILASIALPQYLRVSERSRATEALTVVAAIRQSEQRFKALSAANAYTNNVNGLDIDIPGAGAPASNSWNYSIPLGAPPLARATRIAGGKTLDINIDTGKTCSNDPQYGLPNAC